MVLVRLDLRRWTLESYPIARALLLSLLVHVLLTGTVEVGNRAGLWRTTFLFPKRQARLDAAKARVLRAAQPPKKPEPEPPLVFIEVDPSQAIEEPPKDAKYYSALNSRAANPDPRLDTLTPKIDGKQDKVPQTMEKARPQPEVLQPPPPTPPKVAENKSEPKPPPPQVAENKPEPEPEPPAPGKEPAPDPPRVRPGDLAFAKPSERAKPDDLLPKPSELLDRPKAVTAPARPRTLAAARQQKGMIAGEKMKQQGGVKRFALEPSFDVRATPFGAYDAKIIAAIQKHWYDLLESREFAASYSGKVVLEFRLNSDGRVTGMRMSQSDVTEMLGLLCQRAVQDPAPFEPWPADLRRLVGKEYRDVRFTFYYN